MPGEIGDARDAVLIEFEGVQVQRWLFSVEDGGQLVVGCLYGGEELKAVEELEGV